MKKEFQGISRRSHRLLTMPEGVNVDFKRDLNGLKSRALVSFANTAIGGTILVGVEEYTTEAGVQRGRIFGCPVDDAARLSIINKATDCIPNVHIDVYVENLSRIPFLRIEIPSGRNKPYCTQRGEYAIRADGRGRALYPDELLAIFMDREGEQFISRFRNAVYQLENKVGTINEALNGGMLNVSTHLGSLDEQVRSTLSRVHFISEGVEQNSEDLLQVLHESSGYIHKLEQLLAHSDSSAHKESIDQLRDRINAFMSYLIASALERERERINK
jgi:hypothetical protein